MPKKPSRPKRKRKQNSEHVASESVAAANEKKQVNPKLAALVLLPLLAVGLYFVGTLVYEMAGGGTGTAQNTPEDPSLESSESVTPSSNQAPPVTETESVWKSAQSRSESWAKKDDASSDGWQTELFNEEAGNQFKKLSKLLQHPEDIDAESVKVFASDAISVGQLRPDDLKTVFEDDVVSVQRPAAELSGIVSPDAPSGYEALVDGLRKLVADYVDHENLRVKIKIFRVEKTDDAIRTGQTIELFGKKQSGLIEENLVWNAEWEAEETGRKPKLKSLEVEQYERAERDGGTMFTDCTESIIGDTPAYRQQLLLSYNNWLNQSQFHDFYATPSNPGIAIGDLNNDGLEDMFICQEVGLPCIVYLQNEDGTMRDYSAESNLNLIHNCRCALIVDWNNDGNNDVAIAATGGVVIASGDGTGSFQVETILDTSSDALIMSAADYDLDGRVDLFVGVYIADFADSSQANMPVGGMGGINSNTGGPNSLFHNDISSGNWRFTDVTKSSGLDDNNKRHSQAAAWEDFDNDGDPDLYVANDFGLNNLYRNDLLEDGTRRFSDVAEEMGVQDQAAGMSASWGDYDRDGFRDLYVSNMYSYAGNRITFQQNFKPTVPGRVKQMYQRFARGNSFFRNKGAKHDYQFDDLSVELGVNRARWAWSSRFFDVNNDCWEDLVVANGYITTDDDSDL